MDHFFQAIKQVGMDWCPGIKEEQNSYRSELAGIDGGLSMIAVILKFFDITEGGIEIALDGDSALNSAKASREFLNSFQSSYDLLQDIRNRLTAIPEGIKIKWRWVKLHQDDKGYNKLDWWAKSNIKADKIAKEFCRKCIRNNRIHKPVQLWYEHFAIRVNGIKESKLNKKNLYSASQKDNILNYWRNHHDFAIANTEDIDWESFRLANARLPLGLQRWLVKFATGFIGNRHKLNQRREFPTSKCPNCDHPIEKSSHVLQCKNSQALLELDKNVLKVKEKLSEMKTLPILQDAIIEILKNWKHGKTIRPSKFSRTAGLRDAVTHQSRLGWHNFFLGHWSKLWQQVRKNHLQEIKTRLSRSRWTVSIINKIMHLTYEI